MSNDSLLISVQKTNLKGSEILLLVFILLLVSPFYLIPFLFNSSAIAIILFFFLNGLIFMVVESHRLSQNRYIEQGCEYCFIKDQLCLVCGEEIVKEIPLKQRTISVYGPTQSSVNLKIGHSTMDFLENYQDRKSLKFSLYNVTNGAEIVSYLRTLPNSAQPRELVVKIR